MLCDNGFSALDSYRLSPEGMPYIDTEDGLYVLTRFYGSQELDFMNNHQVSVAVRTIGGMQRAIKAGTQELNTVRAAVYDNPLTERYAKGVKSLGKLKHSLLQMSKKRPQDMSVLKCIDYFTDRAQRAYKGLTELGYGRGDLAPTVAHRGLKEGNIIYSRGRVYIIDWDNMGETHFIEDLAFFINRYIRKNACVSAEHGLSYLSLGDIMSIYLSQNRLSEREMEALKLNLLYPSRFIDVTHDYYRRMKGFVPIGVTAKLEEVIRQRIFTEEYCGV
jgi:thiamine kinase-like enzyme